MFSLICGELGQILDKMSAIEYNINMNQKIVKFAKISDDKCPFLIWLETLDKINKSRVKARLTRLLENNFGDYKKIDNEISELRLHFGSGYRIYYAEIDDMIILLINGGDKSTQNKDIKKAKQILQEWRQNQ